jgi:hypothetical protein
MLATLMISLFNMDLELDRDLLIWIHERLKVLGEEELVVTMHRLRAIIVNTPANKESPRQVLNGIEEVYEKLKGKWRQKT